MWRSVRTKPAGGPEFVRNGPAVVDQWGAMTRVAPGIGPRRCGHSAPGPVAVAGGGEVDDLVPAHEDLTVHGARLPETLLVGVGHGWCRCLPLEVEPESDAIAPLCAPRILG